MMIQPISRYFLLQLNRHDRQVKPLEACISRELSAGRLQPGDPISSPERLAEKLKLSPIEILESVNELLARGVLRQNHNGDLFIAESSEKTAPHHDNTQQVA